MNDPHLLCLPNSDASNQLDSRGLEDLKNRFIGHRLAIFCLGVFCLALKVSAVEVENDILKVVLKVPEGTLQVEDLRTGARWDQYPPARVARGMGRGRAAKIEAVREGALLKIADPEITGKVIRATGRWKDLSFPVSYVLEGDKLSITIDFNKRELDLASKGLKHLMRYPYPFYNKDHGRDAYLPVQEGIVYSTTMLDGNQDPIRFKSQDAYSVLSMPWWGLSDGRSGVKTYMKTFWDAKFAMEWYDTDHGERALPSLQWTTSQGKFDYPRTITYQFIDEGGYVRMAKIFRSMIKETRYFKTWPEKLRENKNILKLKGAPYIWCEYKLTGELVKSLHKAGFKKALLSKTLGPVSKAGEGISAEAIKEAGEAGYLIGKYHNYGWIREGLVKNG